jgi:hypothetical protein
MRVSCCVLAGLTLVVGSARVTAEPPDGIADRARGADQVVVAQVVAVTPSYETNEYGDRLIVSHVDLNVEETLKGKAAHRASLDITGGTLDGITLEVSHEPKVRLGERGVFFMKLKRNGKFGPHKGDEGVLALDAQNRVKGTTVDLPAVRQAVAAAGR